MKPATSFHAPSAALNPGGNPSFHSVQNSTPELEKYFFKKENKEIVSPVMQYINKTSMIFCLKFHF